MPRKPKRPCRYPGCSRLSDDVYCEEHKKLMDRHYEKFSRGYSANERYGSKWKKIRDKYVREHPLCEMCLEEGKATIMDEVHHKISVSEGGSHNESNLMSLCKSCHEKIHRQRGDR